MLNQEERCLPLNFIYGVLYVVIWYSITSIQKVRLFGLLKGTLGQNFTPVFFHIFVDSIEKEPSTKFLGVLFIFR